MATKIRFVNKEKTQFFALLQQRVNAYFEQNHISPHANATMVVKTIFMLALYIVPFVLIVSGAVQGWLYYVTWAVKIGRAHV